MTDEQMKLISFAVDVLHLLNGSPEWGGDTLEYIAGSAYDHGFGETDDEGLFRLAD